MIINNRVRLEGVTKFLTSQYLPKFCAWLGTWPLFIGTPKVV